MEDLKKRVMELLEKHPMISLATITADGKPWVRFVMGRVRDDLTIRIATSTRSRKVAQIRTNPEVHITGGIASLEDAEAYVQIAALAEVSTDPELKREFWSESLEAYFSGPDDEGYAVIVASPYKIEVMGMKSLTPEIWERPA